MLLLEPTNLARIQEGHPLPSPDSLVIICYSPDIEWTAEQLKKVFAENDRKLSPEKLTEILQEGLLRPRIERGEEQASANQVVPLGAP